MGRPIQTGLVQPDERSPLLAFPQIQAPSSASSTSSSRSSTKKGGSVVNVNAESEDSASTDTSLLPDVEANASDVQNGNGPAKGAIDFATVLRAVLVLMIGVVFFHADGSLMLATYPVIASEFNDLESASWLLGGFILAAAATQTIFGKLSDIYGRKNLILISYILFALGW